MKRTLEQLLSSKLHRLCALLYLLVWPFLTIFSRWHDRNMSEPRRTPSFSYNQPIVMIKIFAPKKRIESSHFFPPLFSQMPFAAPLPHQYKWRYSKALNHLISIEFTNRHQELTPANKMYAIETGCTCVSVAEHTKFDPSMVGSFDD